MKLRFLRRCCQLLVIGLFLALPWANGHNFNYIQGSLFSFEMWGIPFADPASAAQAAISGEFVWDQALFGIFLGASFALAIAFICGRVFCGWICPYGFFSEIAHQARVKFNRPLSRKAQGKIWRGKGVFLIICLVLGAYLAYPLITLLSMPGQISLLPLALAHGAGYAVFGALVIVPIVAICCEFAIGRRLWCEAICPQSVFLGFAALALPAFAPGIRINWNHKKCNCGKQNACAQACSLQINPLHKHGPARNICSMCGDCVEACKKHGNALSFSLTSQQKCTRSETSDEMEKNGFEPKAPQI